MLNTSLVSSSKFICSVCQSSSPIIKFGHFTRLSDKAFIQRYRCKNCGHTFSEATFDICFAQKRRDLNPVLFRLLSGGYSQRRSAIDLNVNRKTVVRKFIFLGLCAMKILRKTTDQLPPMEEVLFDDMESFEHTKCKPISMPLFVSKKRQILDFEVCSMPAKGKLAHRARKKYGFRKDERALARKKLFPRIKPLLKPGAIIRSDQNPHYEPDVRKHFPDQIHITHKGRRGCVVGQGELKRGGFDPLFSLNHTCAMFRANINRLFRRTWCTTKIKERLKLHMAIYAVYHNTILLNEA